MSSRHRIIGFIVISFILFVTGCFPFHGMRKSRYTSSVVDYLYPHRTVAEQPSIPHLSLPLRVGIAFVPESDVRPMARALSGKNKIDLMERISSEFRALQFVEDIELIPTEYLTRGGGFTNLDQIKTMYNIDVITLIAYDQVQHTDEGILSFSYLTIIGAYIVQGEKNDTNTMIDAVVYDISSRKMLFRAPGTSHIKGSSTPVNLSEQLRSDSLEGFNQAADNLVIKLKDELDRFKVKIKEMPKAYTVTHKTGYTGGGSIGCIYGIIFLILGGLAIWSGKKK